MTTKTIISIALIALARSLCAQGMAQTVDRIPAHDTFSVVSRAIGETRHINVHTPPGYGASTARFPVLYMPDGGLDEDFPHVVNTVDSLIAAGTIRTTDERGIVGESLAGLFIVETLFSEPTLFTHYVALDPSVWWNAGEVVDSASTRLASAEVMPRTVYLASSDVAEIATGAARLSAVLRAAGSRGLGFVYAPRPDLTHATIFRALEAAALANALK